MSVVSTFKWTCAIGATCACVQENYQCCAGFECPQSIVMRNYLEFAKRVRHTPSATSVLDSVEYGTLDRIDNNRSGIPVT